MAAIGVAAVATADVVEAAVPFVSADNACRSTDARTEWGVDEGGEGGVRCRKKVGVVVEVSIIKAFVLERFK